MPENDLEQRVDTLEKKVSEMERLIQPSQRKKDWRRTVGMFANDPEFDEVLRLGREWRERQNGAANT